MSEIDYGALAHELYSAFERFVLEVLSVEGTESIYVLGLYSSDELNYLGPTGDTRDNLRSRGLTSEEPNAIWTPPEWKHHQKYSEYFSEVERLMLAGWDDDFENFSVDRETVLNIIFEILKLIREKHFRDTTILFGLFTPSVFGDITRASVGYANPPTVAMRLGR